MQCHAPWGISLIAPHNACKAKLCPDLSRLTLRHVFFPPLLFLSMATKFPQSEIIPLPQDVGALGNRINAETRSAHNKIDKLMTLKFGLAIRDPKIYRQGLQSFYHVFKTVEECITRQIAESEEWGPMLQEIFKEPIRREPRARQDLMFYYGDLEKFAEPIMPAQIEFSLHIRKVTSKKPYLLLAYLHVMYLALFAGGRLFRLQLAKATGLFPQVKGKTTAEVSELGTNFFKFEVEDEQLLRIAYKRDYELLTRNGLTEEQKQEVIDEAVYIFEQNAKCVTELEHHNLARLKGKWGYKAAIASYYAVIALMALLALHFFRKLVYTFL